jgi:uncharacterized protein (TIGR02588 family)
VKLVTKSDGKATPLLEWIVGVFGGLIFFGMLAVLIAAGLRRAETPPSIFVESERVTAVENGYVLEFNARNESDVTAADISVVAELRVGDETHHREARFDHLPPRSERRGGFVFESDPRRGELKLRAEGYNEP